jgi:hypothetical protein
MLSTVRADDLHRISRHRTTISDATEKRGGTPVSVLHQKTREVVVYEKTANLVAEIAAAASKG